MEKAVPVWEKFTLSIDEAVDYFGIGENKLRSLVQENLGADFILRIGTKIRIKRKMFENFIENLDAI